MKKFIAIILLAGLVCGIPALSAAERTSFNPSWKFMRVERQAKTLGLAPAAITFDDSNWETVTLPHTAKVETRMPGGAWQGVVWYRKHFAADPAWRDRKVWVEFEAAMSLARVWVNGQEVMTHEGGYLPFIVELGGRLNFDGDNVIAVMVDNRDNPEIPPGKPQGGLDFSYFGGLHRNAWLIDKDLLYITDPTAEGKVAGGGVFVRYENVTRESAEVLVQVHVRNERPEAATVRLQAVILPEREPGALPLTRDLEAEISGRGDHEFSFRLTVPNPRLWSPDNPNLYYLKIFLHDRDRVADAEALRIGIRRIEFKNPGGLFLNGERVDIQGTNRHSEYPYLGNAASDNAQWRDAWKLKRAGFNLVRLSHYPQSPAFYAACDELGLMLIDETPGWQFWNKSDHFKKNVESDVRHMIRRDRNHPSVVLWETVLNESWGVPDEFYGMINRAAHEEYPGDQMFTCGDAENRDPAVANFDVWFAEWNEKKFLRGMFRLTDQIGYVREYGDYEFGGNRSTSRAFRGDGEAAMLLQAWNFQWSLNRNNAQPSIFGSGNWVSIDHNRGGWHNQRVSAPGTFDQFRLPKFVWGFYISQRDPVLAWPALNTGTEAGPLVFIANYWTERRSPAKVVVYSNCEEVELFVNGKSFGRQKPDSGPDTDYVGANYQDPNYWQGKTWVNAVKDWIARLRGPRRADPASVKSFDGGNCRHLAHPPFTFAAVPYEPGELLAVGYIGGKEAASAEVNTPGAPARIELEADFSGRALAADGADFLFVYARVVDAAGTVVPGNDVKVEFKVDGPARLIGENPVAAEAGIATILVQSTGAAGAVKVSATAAGLAPAESAFEAGPAFPRP